MFFAVVLLLTGTPLSVVPVFAALLAVIFSLVAHYTATEDSDELPGGGPD
jgi:hypothetical protein